MRWIYLLIISASAFPTVAYAERIPMIVSSYYVIKSKLEESFRVLDLNCRLKAKNKLYCISTNTFLTRHRADENQAFKASECEVFTFSSSETYIFHKEENGGLGAWIDKKEYSDNCGTKTTAKIYLKDSVWLYRTDLEITKPEESLSFGLGSCSNSVNNVETIYIDDPSTYDFSCSSFIKPH